MKKTYMKPDTLLIKVRMDKMIADSAPTAGIDNSDSKSIGANSVESRRGGLWDDDDDEY